MRTVDDLRTAFTDLADTAPDVDILSLPTARPHRSVRRALGPAAAALVTAAVAGAVLVATVPDDDEPASAADSVAALAYPAAGSPVDTTFRFTAHLPGTESTVRTYTIDRAGQRLEFRKRGSEAQCSLVGPVGQRSGNCGRLGMVTLLYRGRPTSSDVRPFDADRLVGRVRQDVDGRRGYFGTPQRPSAAAPGLTEGLTSVHLFWQYAPDAWGDALAPTRARALALARSVRPATGGFMAPAVLEPRPQEYLDTFEAETSSTGGSYDLTSTDAKHGTVRVSWGAWRYIKIGEVVGNFRGTSIGGRTWVLYEVNGRAEAELKNSATPIAVSADPRMSLATLRSYVERVRLAPDLTDPGTWFRASELR